MLGLNKGMGKPVVPDKRVLCYTLGHILVRALYCTFILCLCVLLGCLSHLPDLPRQLPLSRYLAVTSRFGLPYQTFLFHLTFSRTYSPFLLTPLDSLSIDMCTRESVFVRLTHSLLQSTCYHPEYLLIHS
jgi:hypothetical protein